MDDNAEGNEKQVEQDPKQEPRKRVTARMLLQQYYERMSKRLAREGNGKLLKQLDQLIDMEQKLSGSESKSGKRIQVKWDPGKKKE